MVGLWSHMAYADAPAHPTIAPQVRVFEEAVERGPAAGVDPRCGTWPTPRRRSPCRDTWYDLVRPGVALYGLTRRRRPGRGTGCARR